MTDLSFPDTDCTAPTKLKVVGVNATTTAPTRYRVDVIGSTAADVVLEAGGWLFDRAIRGWDVNVHLANCADSRPLQILGVKSLALQPGFESSGSFLSTQALAVAVEMVTGDAAVRAAVNAALDHCHTEVTLWGAKCPSELHRRLDTVLHDLSAAARAYKAQALVAAGVHDYRLQATEKFRNCARLLPHDDADLAPLHSTRSQRSTGTTRQAP